MDSSLYNFLLTIIISQSFFLGGILLAQFRYKNHSKGILGLLNLVFATTASSGLYTALYLDSNSYSIPVFSPLNFLYGPILLCYVFSEFQKSSKAVTTYLAHLTPFVLSVMAVIVSISLEWEYSERQIFFKYYALAQKIHIATYISAAFIIFVVFTRRLELYYSNFLKTDIFFIKYLLFGYLVIFSSSVWNIFDVKAFLSVSSIFFLALGIRGYVQPNLIGGKRKPVVQRSSQNESQKAHEKLDESGNLTADQVRELSDAIIKVMEDHKDFKDPNLSLPKLAAILNISTHQLSELLN